MAGSEEPADLDRLVSQGRLTQAIIESAIDGIITIDCKGIVHSFNAAAERIFGYGRDEAIGRNISFLMPSPDREQHADYLNRYLTTREPRIIGIGRNVIGLRKDGGEVHIRLAVAEYEEHGQTMFVGFTQDVTDLNQARTEARDYLDKLAHLNRVNAMGEMVTDLAHEIRQPLSAIQFHAAAARTMLASGDIPDASLDDSLGQIIRQSTHANDIIGEMRDFLKRDLGREKETVDVFSIVDNVLTLLSHEIRSAGIHFALGTGNPRCLCHVNRIQIEQVLFNLIHNAIDSLRESDEPRVLRLSCERQKADGQCVISVEDNGKGIPEEHMDQLWERGFTTKAQGMGQGLSICRSILEGHDGELYAENAPDRGAVFRFVLPLVERA